jgi:hypothetical protein
MSVVNSSSVSSVSYSSDQLRSMGYRPTSEAAQVWGVSETTLKRRASNSQFLSSVNVVRDSRGGYWFQVYRTATEQARMEGISRRTLGRRMGQYNTVEVNNRRYFVSRFI